MKEPPDLSRYRPNVGLAIFHVDGRVFLGYRAGVRSAFPWQMPQGGVDDGEDLEAAAFRELREETGIRPEHVELLGQIPRWMPYDYPPEIAARAPSKGRLQPWIGQKQWWFAFRLIAPESVIDLSADPHIEFLEWRWERLADVPAQIIPWKRPVYERVAAEFAAFARPVVVDPKG